MSAICGVVELGGHPAIGPTLDRMRQAIEYWGPDGGGLWTSEAAGLAQLAARRTPESAHESGPVELRGGELAVTAAGRLDNRQELCVELGIAPPDRPRTPDGRLIALAYDRWEDGTPQRILGDWAFAAFDRRHTRLVLARDHYGQTALYYHRSGDALMFASSLKALLALPNVPRRLNELHLAQHLAIWPTDGAATYYDAVYRLPPAHMLVFDRGGVRTREFWHPENAPPVRLARDEDYVEEFLELFGEAVRTRLRSSAAVASTLSAGLDSGLVTAVAAIELAQTGSSLLALTAVPAFAEAAEVLGGDLVDEWPGARLVAARYSNLDHLAVRSNGLTPSRAIERSLEVHEEPEYAVPNLPWLFSVLASAKDRGANVLLTGQAGNVGVSWPGDVLLGLHRLLQGDARGAARAVKSQRVARGGGWARALVHTLVLPLRQRVRGELFRRGLGVPPRRPHSLINPDFERRIDLRGRMRRSGFDPTYTTLSVREQRVLGLLPGITPGGALCHQHGAAAGLDLRDPTADVRVLEFCLGMPEDQFLQGANDRWLIRRALAGLVPAEVQWNRTRGTQGADFAFCLRADAEEVDAAVEAVTACELASAYVDSGELRRCWALVRNADARSAIQAAPAVGAGLLIGRFLGRFGDSGARGRI